MVMVIYFEFVEYALFLTLFPSGIHSVIKQSFQEGYTVCSTPDNSPLVFEGIHLKQFKELQERFRNISDDHYVCDLGDDRNCDSWWNVEDWYKANSIISSGMTELLTDERWEGLEVLQLKNRYTRLFSVSNEFDIVPMSWSISGDSELLFCPEEVKINYEPCLKISFTDGSKNFSSKDRHILNVEIKRKLEDNKWRGFIWTMEESGFKVLKYNNGSVDQINHFADSKKNYRHLFGRSIVQEDFVKIHKYNFLRTEKAGLHQIGRPFRTEKGKICITMYVAMCRNCKMVFIMSEAKIAEVTHAKEGTWKHIRIYVIESQHQYEQLYVLTIGNSKSNTEKNYWAMDFVRKCSDDRSITIKGNYKCYIPYPHVPRTLQKYSNSLIVKYSTLNIPFFRVTSYVNGTISYMFRIKDNELKDEVPNQPECSCSARQIPLRQRDSIEVHKCRLWPNYFCASIELTEPKYYLSYAVDCTCIFRKINREEVYLNFFLDNSLLKNTGAGAPKNLIVTTGSNKNALHLTWSHPFLENGALTGFQIEMIRADKSAIHLEKHKQIYNIKTPKNSYNFTCNFDNYESCAEYFIQVRAINNKGLGYASTELITSPPLLPAIEIKKKGTANITFSMTMAITRMKKCRDKYDNFGHFVFVLIPVTQRNPSLEMDSSILEIFLDMKFSGYYSIIKKYRIENVNKGSGIEGYFKDLMPINPKTGSEYELATISVNSTERRDLIILEMNDYNGHIGYFAHKYNFFDHEKSKDNSALKPGGETNEKSDGNLYWIVFICGVLIFTAVVGTIMCSSYVGRMCEKHRKKKMIKIMAKPPGDRGKLLDSGYAISAMKLEEPSENSYEIPQGQMEGALQDNSDSKPVRIVDFEKYVKISMTNKELTTQFQSLPTKPTKSCQAGKLEHNKPKNRFQDILPYDDSRVKLQTMENKEGSDYINASYILGHQKKKSYIAAQGPKSLTINDFWRMVWQENVRNIIMLVNLAESGVKKVEKYWPDPKEDFQFGKIHIYHHSSETWADYEIRVFRLVCDGSERKIHQYHFQNWPDNGVPIPFQSLIPFIRKTMEINTKSPILVHCCSGTSATGAFILCHIGLEMADQNGVIDIFRVAKQLREQRVNMIHNLSQYKLVHLLIYEYIFGLQQVISCTDDLDVLVGNLTSPAELKLQMSYLEDLSWQYRALFDNSDYEQIFTVFTQKNKTEDIFPDALGAIELEKYPVEDESSCYINAVSVEGYQCYQRYIVTQQPMPNTLNDFWRMVIQKNVKVVISLNNIILKDKKSCTVWPTEDNPVMSPVDFIIIKHQSTVINDLYDVIKVLVMVQGKKKKSMNVTIAELKGWKPRALLPKNVKDFLKFCGFVDSITRQMKNTVVTCYDGCLASGIYVAASYLIEMIKVQKSFDVCSAVRAIRTNRTQFITEEKQLAFLYEIASTYIKGYQDYANFAAGGQACQNLYDYIEWTKEPNQAEYVSG